MAIKLEDIQLALGAATLIGVLFAVYKYFRNPDVKADKEIAVMKEGCKLKHEALDKDISGIHKTLAFIQDNHLRHIEKDISEVKTTQSKILGILEAKYQIKIQD